MPAQNRGGREYMSKAEWYNGTEWEEIPLRNADRERQHWKFDEAEIVTTSEYLTKIEAEDHIRFEADGERVFAGRVAQMRERGNGLTEIRAFSYGKYALRDDGQVQAESGDTNIDLMQEIVQEIEYLDDDGNLQTYTLNAPSTESIEMGGYSYNGKLMKGKQELERKVKWTLWTEPDGEAYYQPLGHGETDEEIVIGEDKASVSNWEPEIVETVVSKVRVKGVNADGEKVSVTVEADSPEAENFVDISLDFNVSENEAEEIGKAYLQPLKGAEARLVQRYDGASSRFNKSIQFEDPDRTDGETQEFFIQREEITTNGTLELTLERAPRFNLTDIEITTEEELENERSELIIPDDADVNIGFNDFDAEASDADPDVSGFSSGAFGDQDYTYTNELANAISDGTTVSTNLDAPNLTPQTEAFLVSLNLDFYQIESVSGNIELEIRNDDKNETLFDESLTIIATGGAHSKAITIVHHADQSDPVDGETIQARVTNDTGDEVSYVIHMTVDSWAQHDHGGTSSFGGISGSMNADSHGSPDSDFPHALSGGESSDNVKTSQSDKDNR